MHAVDDHSDIGKCFYAFWGKKICTTFKADLKAGIEREGKQRETAVEMSPARRKKTR